MSKKNILCLSFVMLLIFYILFPKNVFANSTYDYINELGQIKNTGSIHPIPVTGDTRILDNGWYVANHDVTVSSTITVKGHVFLLLVDGCTLTVNGTDNNAGINVSSGNSLTVYGQAGGTGTLYAQGATRAAGIGSGNGGTVGTINICSGTVTAIGGSGTYFGDKLFGSGAGIGGGYYSTSGTINFFGGTVTATGGEAHSSTGAGIGGGGIGTGGKINISGGIVTATGGEKEPCNGAGAGIGGGGSGEGGTILISGGEVTAIGGQRGAGIGGGDYRSGGSITIRGGKVNASSKYGGAGIGGGYLAVGGTINIQGGDITASGGMWGAGIGSGGYYNAGNITITGGTVNANGGDYGAGIGAGGHNSSNTHNGGTIQILGGKVTVKGGSSGMDAGLDIGRGRNGINGTLLVDDGALVTLTANGIDSSATTLGTCILKGSAAGALLGVYEDGTKINGTMIDISNPDLSNGTGFTISGDTITLTGSGNTYVLFDNTIHRRFVVSSGKTANVMLFSANIKPTSGCAFNMTGATVNMQLVGNSSLSSSGNFAGLQVPAGSTLSINGSGSLTTTGGNNGGAGIGGGKGASAGSITFSGGRVSAVGGGGGAGIGGGNGGAGGSVLVDGENTMVSSAGDQNGYDIGSGHNNSSGGSLTLKNNATVNLNRNGTNANTSFIDGVVGGDGAELLAGTYKSSLKLLTFTNLIAEPPTDVKAFENVTLTAHVTGLSSTDPQGQMVFYVHGVKIGQAPLNRQLVGSANGVAECIWSPQQSGNYTLTAQYVQNPITDSYYMTNTGKIEEFAVAKADQLPLIISGVSDRITYGDSNFTLGVSGGSGTGSLSYSVTEGDAVSVDATTGIVTVNKAGSAIITVTKDGDSQYKPESASINITVNKATPPEVVFPSASSITYGQKLFNSVLTGGSGNGGFSWQEPETVPPVNNAGYTVIFTPKDTDNYDYTGITLSERVDITVNKAIPTVTFPSASEIIYGQSLSDSELIGGVGYGTFAWKNPDTVPTVLNSGYPVIFTPEDAENFTTITQTVTISVLKANQSELTIKGVPDRITYGDAPFALLIGGGSGTGSLSFAVTEGDAVTVDDVKGIVTVVKAGPATITVTKAGDPNYNAQDANVTIIVDKAIPAVIFPKASDITYGQPLLDSILTGGIGNGIFTWESPDIKPTVINSGYDVIFTPNDTDNYLTIKQSVALVVNKSLQAPLTVGGIPNTITYGDTPFYLSVGGGNGLGSLSYAVVSGDAVTVDAAGKVTILHGGRAVIKITHSGDDNYLPILHTFSLNVHKAAQSNDLSFELPQFIAYGDVPFQIFGSGGRGTGRLSYRVSKGDAIKVSGGGIVEVIRPGVSIITVVKAGDKDYLSQEKEIQVCVNKGIQSPLVISGVPDKIITGQAPFKLKVRGGSGVGGLSYAVTSGNAVSLKANGTVTILRPGTALITVTKAEDNNYLATTTTVEINIKSLASTEKIEETSFPSLTPTVTPTITETPSPRTTDKTRPTTTNTIDVALQPLSIQADEYSGVILATISRDDLPDDTAAISLPSGETIQLDKAQNPFKLSITQEDINGDEEIEFIALNASNIPLGHYRINLSNTLRQNDSTDSGGSFISVLVWIGASIFVICLLYYGFKRIRIKFPKP